MMNIVVNGTLTTYQRSGEGPVVVILHGWGDSSASFKQLSVSLAEQFTVIAVDLPGFGGTQKPEQVFGLTKYAVFVQQFLEKLGVDDIYAYIGHSNGGAIAIRGLSNGQLHTKKLVLLASAGIRSTYKGRKLALRLAAKTLKQPTKLLPAGTQEKLKKRAYKAVGSDLFVAEDLQETFKAVVSDDVLEESASISVPTLLMYGDQDQTTPISYGEKFAATMPHAQLKRVEGADHFLFRTHHDQVVAGCLEFLHL